MTVAQTGTDLEHWYREYWLGHCEGFRVEDETRRLGIVDEVVGPEGEPKVLLVRGGLFAKRVYEVPMDDVLEIEPRAERIRLRMGRNTAR
jgi:hypothetical protein